MRFVRLLLGSASIALPMWLAVSTPAEACTYSLVDSIHGADIIAVGTVGEMLVLPQESITNPNSLGDRMPVEIKFSVAEFLKGSGASQLLVFQPAANITYDAGQISAILDNYTSCGRQIHFGDQYVALLSKSDSLRFSLQLGSQPFTEAGRQLVMDEIRKTAGPPDLPVTGFGAGPASHNVDWPLPITAGAIGLACATAFLALTRRRS